VQSSRADVSQIGMMRLAALLRRDGLKLSASALADLPTIRAQAEALSSQDA